MYACICRGVTVADVQQAGREGVFTAGGLINTLGLDHADCCGRCKDDVEPFVTLALDAAAARLAYTSPLQPVREDVWTLREPVLQPA